MSNKGGWIKLYRELLDKPIWFESTPEQKVILVTLLLMANHDGRQWEWQGQQYYAGPGQFVTSLSKIAEKAGPGISMQNVRTALKRFEKFNFLTNQSTKVNRLITIVNWGIYQDNPNEPNKDDNSQLTKSQQSTNKELTTNKNVRNKECKNIDVVNENSSSIQNVIAEYEQVFGIANSLTIQNIQFWCQDTSPELVIAAISESKKANTRSFKYTEAILKNWEKAGIKTIEDVKAYNERFQSQKNYGKQKNNKGYQNDVELPF
ncbi:DnaD domain-containing protein [Enterococcus cecorum]|uniref:DnaD domain-containing protein n=1 Tax=Enterococcus cecorum TaxID=44008 RepID=UPI003F23D819